MTIPPAPNIPPGPAVSPGSSVPSGPVVSPGPVSPGSTVSPGPTGVARFNDPEFHRLLKAVRRSLERTGWDLGRTIVVKDPTEAERKAISGITGKYHRPGIGRIEIPLRDLDAAVQASTGLTLPALLEEIGPPLRDRPAENAADAAARSAVLEAARSSPLHSSASWYRDWLTSLVKDGTVSRLLRRPETADALAQAVRVLEFLEARPTAETLITLAELAVRVTGDTKALNIGRGRTAEALPRLVLRAIAIRTATPRPDSAEERRRLWESVGVVPDDLASRVLVLNLPAEGAGLGEWLTGAAGLGVPFHVTLHQLTALPITVRHPVVHVCENPAVLRRASAELGSAALPLLCTEGRPSTAFHRLAEIITSGGGTLRYHGDFDWPGIAMTNSLITRHGAVPWRMSAADYVAAVTAESDHISLDGTPQPTPWDPALAELMAHHRHAIYEEAVADPLIADLSRHG
ncbi:TIGR02679 family protein [Thermopolyspora sp. NPDC052614]|uniref:TIGR02679 family protein n=1 Tax=Thermopolyspora sp. NPDC052614 TaxID=3155682 RepID=UPI00343386AF